jgi:transcriptional regulator with XRE-family HTH domain
MMDCKEYLTIKEFADAAGVSKQAVYQRLTGTLKPYVSVKDGVKYLNIRALELYKGDDAVKKLKKNNQEESNSVQVDSMVELLKRELDQKNKQIDELHKLLEQSQVNLSQAQYRLQLIEEKQMQEQSEADQTEQEPVKKTWWQKLFG